MACPKCEIERASEKLFCRHCFEIYPQPPKAGLLRRWLGLGPKEPVERLVAPDPKAGEHDIRLAEFARDAIQDAKGADDPSASTHVEAVEEYSVADDTGEETVYESLDEMPPELRSAVSKALTKSEG